MEITFVCPCCEAVLAIDAGIRSKRVIKRNKIQMPGYDPVPIDRFKLSQRDSQVAELMVEGLRNKQIADRLGISRGSVGNVVCRIYDKVGCSSRGEFFALVRASQK